MKLDLQTPPAAGDSGTANEEIRRRNLNVLTPQRAVRFITDATNTVRLLDRYLSQPVGKFRYHISQRKDNAHAAIWPLLSSGLEPTDPFAAAIRDSEAQSAKEELMRAVNTADKFDDRARRLLDYRNCHRYEIEIAPADQPDVPPIQLSRSGRNLSGGEGQVPFSSRCWLRSAVYMIAVTAPRRARNSWGSLSWKKRFQSSPATESKTALPLPGSFQLQLVMAFPPESVVEAWVERGSGRRRAGIYRHATQHEEDYRDYPAN